MLLFLDEYKDFLNLVVTESLLIRSAFVSVSIMLIRGMLVWNWWVYRAACGSLGNAPEFAKRLMIFSSERLTAWLCFTLKLAKFNLRLWSCGLSFFAERLGAREFPYNLLLDRRSSSKFSYCSCFFLLG